MKSINEFIFEKILINKDTTSNNQYASNWQWFNALITNVNLTEENYEELFANLTDDELTAWIKEVKDCYIGVGTPKSEDAKKIGDDVDLARFYAKYPIKE